MGEFIVDNFKAEAMKVPFLRDLLRSDSIKHRVQHHLRQPRPALDLSRPPRQSATRAACRWPNTSAGRSSTASPRSRRCRTCRYFIERAHDLYGYDNFIADTGGSLIEVVDPDDPEDPVIKTLSEHTALLYIRGTEKDAAELVRRFKQLAQADVLPPAFLIKKWAEFKKLNKVTDDCDVDPDAFGAWGFEALLHDRLPRYQKLADNFGYTVEAADLATVRDGDEFIDLDGRGDREANALARSPAADAPSPESRSDHLAQEADHAHSNSRQPARPQDPRSTRASCHGFDAAPRGRTSARCRSACST